MPWKTQGGGPWGGRGPSSPQPPDIEEFLRRGQNGFRKFMPGGVGPWRGFILIILAVVALWLASGFYRVQPEEQGVVLLFGKYTQTTAPGLHWFFPSPVGTVYKPKVTRVHRTQVGFRSDIDVQRPGVVRNVPQESLMLTGDENIIDIQFVAFWVIKDAEKFLFNIRNSEITVKDASESAMREIIGTTDFELARTKDRVKVEKEAQSLIQRILDDFGAGIEVTRVQLQKIDPPGNVLNAFRDVQAARADKERAVNEGEAYRNEVVERAEGEAAKIINAAQAYREQKIAIATGESQRFLSVLEEYMKDKEVTKRRIYLETMKSVMGDMEKVLIDNRTGGSGVVPYLPLPELKKRSGGEADQ